MVLKKVIVGWMVASMISILCMASPAAAALSAVGAADLPVPPEDGFPAWYQDSTGLSLAKCLDMNGNCIMLGDASFNPANPVVFPTNYPGEHFYFMADTLVGSGTYRAALEAAFSTGVPRNGDQIVFARIRFRTEVPVTGTYTLTHPYGTQTFSVDALVQGPEIDYTDDIGLTPLAFTGALGGQIGPFLLPTTPRVVAGGNVYLASPATPVTVTGSPTGNNFVRLQGPAGSNLGGLGTDFLHQIQFTIAGKVIGMSVTPASITFPAQQNLVITTSVTVTVANVDTVNSLTLGQLTSTGTNSANFTVLSDLCSSKTLTVAGNPGSSCTFNVNFSGTGDGLKTAQVNIPATAPANMPPGTVFLNGTIDTTAPFVSSRIPAVNAINVPANNDITATFSEHVTNVTTSTFILSTNGTPTVAGMVLYDPASRTATFAPAVQLVSNVTYTATITSGVVDVAGNALANTAWGFLTTISDLTPPAVISKTPAHNSSGVATGAAITATFNEPIDVNSVNATTFMVSGGTAGVVTYDQATRTATFTPNLPLAYYQPYTVTIFGVNSLGKIPMTASYSWTFLTNGAPTQPQLVSPVDASSGHGSSVSVSWLKSTDIDGDPVTYSIYYCSNPYMIGPGGCTTPIMVSAKPSVRDMFAGLGGFGGGLLLAGIAIVGGARSRKKVFHLFAVLLIFGMVVAACGSGGSSSPPAPNPNLMSQAVSSLAPGTKYYWQVVADDGKGGTIRSETWSFSTN